jgi:hypothetical protein
MICADFLAGANLGEEELALAQEERWRKIAIALRRESRVTC